MASVSSQHTAVIDISPEEFIQLTPRPHLIDVRSSLEYRWFHAPEALNLSLPTLLLGRFSLLRRWFWPQWFRVLPRQQAVAVICLTAHRSPLAANFLADEGFNPVYNLVGGMMAWKKSGLTTCQGSSPT